MIDKSRLMQTWNAFLEMYVLAMKYNDDPSDSMNAEKLVWIIRRLYVHLADVQKDIEDDGKQ